MPAILAMAYHSLVGSSGPGQQRILGDRLRRELWDRCRTSRGTEGGSTSQRCAASTTFASIIRFSIEKLRRVAVIRENAADLGGGHDDGVWPGVFRAKPRPRPAASNRPRFVTGGDHLAILAGEAPRDGGADHAFVAGDPDPLARQADR